MTQFPPATHAGDPATAHAAEAAVTASGRRLSHAQLVLTTVERNPGRTAKEYGALTLLGHIEAQRRLSDLKNNGEVVMGAPEVYDGSRCVTWRVPGAGVQGTLL